MRFSIPYSIIITAIHNTSVTSDRIHNR